MTTMAAEQHNAKVENLLRTMPPGETFGNDTPERFSWLGRASIVLSMWNTLKGVIFNGYVSKINSRMARDVEAAVPAVLPYQCR